MDQDLYEFQKFFRTKLHDASLELQRAWRTPQGIMGIISNAGIVQFNDVKVYLCIRLTDERYWIEEQTSSADWVVDLIAAFAGLHEEILPA